VWPDGRRKKKLIIAFHFQFANQAAWRCGDCRKQGLERQRGCPFIQIEGTGTERRRIVWARREVAAFSCPKALIRAESLRWLEEFSAWKASGGIHLMRLPARTAEAFFVLEQELGAEQNYARQDSQYGTQ
jgi:hypothetical protein